jgi:hypothetical protein
MSVTTSGPFTPVVRRITPSGDVNRGESVAGVRHPFTHVLVVSPRVGGGEAGGDGGATEALAGVAPEEPATITGVSGVVGCATLGPLRHAAADAATTTAATTTGNRCIRGERVRRTAFARITEDRC